ncbi:hypothetical protein IWW50_003164, partial [Coemansia erecta]
MRWQSVCRVRLNAKARRWAIVAAAGAAMVLVLRMCGYLRYSGEGPWGDESVATVDRRFSCAEQPLDATVWNARGSGSAQPFAILPAVRRAGERSTLNVIAGQPVCIRVVVPPTTPAG